MNLKFLIVFIVASYKIANAQGVRYKYLDKADEHFSNYNFLDAIPHYELELKKDPWNNEIRHRLALCYLNTRVNRDKAIPLLEEVSKDPTSAETVWIDLGKAYQLALKFDEAIVAFEKHGSIRSKNLEEATRYIKQCKNAIQFIANPKPVNIQNLGPTINSAEPDYNPFINADETSLIFTSRRLENFGGKKVEIDGYRSSDVYQSVMEHGQWSAPTNLGKNINGKYDEQIVGMSHDGLQIFLYFDHIESYGNIYTASREDLSSPFSKAAMCNSLVNSEIETSGCLSADGEIMFFARRSKLEGTSDLFIARKLPNGKWATPERLPDIINTPYNEDMPYLSQDGKTLYFSSEGHNSMGGFDLFKTTWKRDENTFSIPENLGYPINSVEDDRSICVSRDNQLAYISAFKTEGVGDLDIYRVAFDNLNPVSVIYTGQIYLGDLLKEKKTANYNVRLTVVETNTNLEYIFVPHSSTGRYVMALPAGDYKLVTDAQGYLRHKEEFTVSDMGKINSEREKNLQLKKSSR